MRIEVNKYVFDKFAALTICPKYKIGDIIDIPNSGVLEGFSAVNYGSRLCSMGAVSYSNSILPRTDIKMGRYCSIAVGLEFIKGKHPLDLFSTSCCYYDPFFKIFTNLNKDNKFEVRKYSDFIQPSDMTILENDVYVCTNALLKPGITLHTGCVVAERAIVTKDVPPYAIVGGAPARVLKYRFEKEICERLLALKWWEYNYADFCGIDLRKGIENFLNIIEKRVEIGDLRPYNFPKTSFEELIELSKHKKITSAPKPEITNVPKPKNIGARARVENFLSYRLGAAMIQNSKSFFGILILPFILRKIAKDYKLEQAVLKANLRFNANLKVPNLNEFDDYAEAMSFKKHLSFMLGEAFLKACKKWYFGGLIKFAFIDIIKIKREFKQNKS